MKQKHFKVIAAMTVVLVLLFTFIPMSTLSTTAAEITYEKSGLVSLYLGTDNTGSGHNNAAKTWKDLAGNNDITNIETDANNHFTDKAFLLNKLKVYFPDAIKNLINSDEFSVEIAFGKFESLGTTYNTVMNCSSDSFSLFRRNAGDFIEFKNGSNARPKVAGGLEYFKNSTITVTFKVDGKVTLYVDGVQIGQESAAAKIVTKSTTTGEDLFWFGHDTDDKTFEAEYLGMRFYSKELTAAQVKSNYQQDKAILYGGSATTTTSTPTTETTPSTPTTETQSSTDTTSKATSSAATSANTSSATASKSNSTTTSSKATTGSNVSNSKDDGDNTIVYICIAVAVVAVIAGVTFVIIKKKKK